MITSVIRPHPPSGTAAEAVWQNGKRNTHNERMRPLATIAILFGLALAAVAPAHGAPDCGDVVVADWSDGRIDGRYAPRCYGDAIDALPEDVRAYSTAEEDIGVALGTRLRELRARPPARDDSGASPALVRPVPILLLSGAGLGLAIVLVALARIAAPRLRERFGHRARPIGQW